MVQHFGDTGEFAILNRAAARPARRRWSRCRSVTCLVAVIMTFVFVIDVVGHPRHGLDIGQLALDFLRANWVIALIAMLAAWAYDAVSPKLWSRFAALRTAARDIQRVQQQLLDRQRWHEEQVSAEREQMAATAAAQVREYQAMVLKLDNLIGYVSGLGEKLDDHDVDTYIEAFQRAKSSPTVPQIPKPSPDPDRSAVVSLFPKSHSNGS